LGLRPGVGLRRSGVSAQWYGFCGAGFSSRFAGPAACATTCGAGCQPALCRPGGRRCSRSAGFSLRSAGLAAGDAPV